MIIETFEIEESTDEMALMAADSEGIDLIKKLGLSGQDRFVNGDTATRFPYRKMTKEEGLVYGLLCPQKTTVENYSEGIIPLRVLQVISHAGDLEFFDAMNIWHPENADIKDPVLVGSKKVKTGPGEYSYNTELYILARWGDMLPSFEELRDLAKKMWCGNTKAKLIAIKREVETAIGSIDELKSSETMGRLDQSPYFSFNF